MSKVFDCAPNVAERYSDVSVNIEDTPAGAWCWHVGYEGKLMDVLIEPWPKWRTLIRGNTPAWKMAIVLKYMRPVSGALPRAVVEAGKHRTSAWNAMRETWKLLKHVKHIYGQCSKRTEDAKRMCTEAQRIWGDSLHECVQAMQDNLGAIQRLHAEECPNCPWDGKTLIPNTGEPMKGGGS